MWLKWLPWKYIVRQAARRRGFIDPITLMARFNAFAQPAETAAPLELLRAGAVLHARGFLNNNVIQHNLDWVWPYWVDRQFDPASPAFIPRAFSMTHINLTQRNWTAVGYPGCAETPVVDARGLLMPFFDSWSIDVWYRGDDGSWIVPSRMKEVTQALETGEGGDALRVVTTASREGATLRSEVEVVDVAGAAGDADHEDAQIAEEGVPACRVKVSVRAPGSGWVVVSLRPYNPEGVSFVNDLSLLAHDEGWEVNQARTVHFSRPPDEHLMSRYRDGDVFLAIDAGRFNRRAHTLCEVGMITGAALYRVDGGGADHSVVEVTIPLTAETAAAQGRNLPARSPAASFTAATSPAAPRVNADLAARALPARLWREAMAESVPLRCAAGEDAAHMASRYGFLYETALRTTTLLAPRAVYAGPYTYKRFWYRDAVIIIHALMCAGHRALAERALDHCVEGQTLTGYFKSQEGEWDSNGQVLWALGRYCRLFGVAPKTEWVAAIRKAVRWIHRKRVADVPDKPTSGLLPAGFSAEHFGPNDYYYWDDFWSVSGLRFAEEMLRAAGDPAAAAEAAAEAESLARAIDQSLAMVAARTGSSAMPASPHRRMDSGAIGSIAVGFPLQLWSPDDKRLQETVEYLLKDCLVEGGFYHDINHSGINPYLTLHIAQCLLRAGDDRFRGLMGTIARLASPTGQWPEAVHPQLGTGCMGDGQHAWAAAEWLMMIRNSFVFEEEFEDLLVVAAGLSSDWCGRAGVASFGPAPTRFGPVTVTMARTEDEITLKWRGEWFNGMPRVDVRFREKGWTVVSSEIDRVVLHHIKESSETAEEGRAA